MSGAGGISSVGSGDRALPALRADLRIARRSTPDGEEFILHDSAGRHFFRLGPREWAVARLLDGRRCAAEVAVEISRILPDEPADAEEVAAFAQRLAMAGVLRLSGAAELQRLSLTRRRHWSGALAGLVGRMFYFRIPLGNPDRLVGWLTPLLARLITPAVLKAALGLVIITALMLLWRIDDLLAPQAEFLTGRGLLWLLAAMLLMKVFHELAHAVTCSHFGGRVPEVGLAFIVLTPCLYCDVSEAWMMPERHRRMAITAAGMFVELFVATLAAIVFMITRPGWLHQVSFSVMVVGSLQTLLFNGNPLLRFDGYYLLSDWLETPNLRLRARAYARSLMRRLMWGPSGDDAGDAGDTGDTPERHRLLLAAYAVASYLYGWMILYAILGLLYWKLARWGLQGLAALLIAMTVITQVGLPAYQGAALLVSLARHRGHVRRFARAGTVAALVLLAIAAIMAIPVNEQVTRSFVLEPVSAAEVRSERGGRIVRVLKAEGALVRSGDVLIELADEALDREIELAASRVAEAEVWCDAARQKAGPVEVAAALRQLDESRSIEQALVHRRQSLKVRAPRDGVLLAVPAADWVGLTVPAGTMLAQVAPADQLRATLQLSAADARRVPTGASAALLLRAAPQADFRGRVSGNGWQASRNVHAALTVAHGGEVSVARDGADNSLGGSGGSGDPGGANFRPAESLYRADIAIFEAPAVARPGMSGRARIYLGRTSLGSLVWRRIVDELSLDLLLPG